MIRGAALFLGILGVILSLAVGYYSIVAWDIVAALVTASIGIPSLVLAYKVRQEGKSTQGITKSHFLSYKPRKTQENRSKAESPNFTDHSVDNDLLDHIYNQAHQKAIAIYDDAELSAFSIIIHPFVASQTTALLSFYSKWAEKVCVFIYSENDPQVKHMPPDRHPQLPGITNAFVDLPWKKSPKWNEFIKKAYSSISPFAKSDRSYAHLWARQNGELKWHLKFDDSFSGNTYSFEWNGKSLNEKSVKRPKLE